MPAVARLRKKPGTFTQDKLQREARITNAGILDNDQPRIYKA